MSSGVPSLRSVYARTTFCSISSLYIWASSPDHMDPVPVASRFGGTTPGHTTLRVMPCLPTSRAIDFDVAMTAALVPEYTASRHSQIRPATDALETMRPHGRLDMDSSQSRVH